MTSESRAYRPDGLLRRDTITGAAGAFLRYLKFDWASDGAGDASLVSTLDGATNYGLVENGSSWIASTRGGTPTAVAQDVFGSVINSTGQALANATGWDPFGVPTGSTATNAATLGYRGEATVLTETYLRARSYQASTGSFTTVDPLDDVLGKATSGNKYHYAFNDPINREDPSGMRPKETDDPLCINGWKGSDANHRAWDEAIQMLGLQVAAILAPAAVAAKAARAGTGVAELESAARATTNSWLFTSRLGS